MPIKKTPKQVVVLGSTGSLGSQTLEVLEKYPEEFRVVGLSANVSAAELNMQAKKYKVKNIMLAAGDGKKALEKLAGLPEADIVVNVLSGIAGLKPAIAALNSKKILLLGNKESLVAEGKKMMSLAKNRLIPIDSEHNAIFEILKKYPHGKIKKIIIPCSGGPFWGKRGKELESITAKEALRHPKWHMGAKISLESAIYINKGMEIIEAHHLFNIPFEKIEIKIHPECFIHGMVEFEKEIIGYISRPDMKEHIENALLRAANLPLPPRKIEPIKLENFTFLDPNALVIEGINTVLNAGNYRQFLKREEKILRQFLDGEIKFTEILENLRKF
ncbi:hypothetical protein HYW82_02860 [Candidatus Peregrinibacteria bacterium]|nr:hypothetical protein [Candidatus Peregrinibacteria bacterium]